MKQMLFALALAIPAAALAQTAPTVSLTSKTFVARAVKDAAGKTVNKLFPASNVLPNEAVVFVLEYRNGGAKPAAAFEINNPVPGAVSFAGVEQPWAVVSVDGGKTFGALATLKVRNADGTSRPANPGEVTHVRWKFAQPIPAGGSGKVTYFGKVK